MTRRRPRTRPRRRRRRCRKRGRKVRTHEFFTDPCSYSVLYAFTGSSNSTSNEDKGLEPQPSKDDDPTGLKLLQAPDPLERAAKLLEPLRTLASGNIDAWIAIYDVAVRRSAYVLLGGSALVLSALPEKYLQAVKAHNSVRALDAEHPELHVRLAHLRHTCESAAPPQPDS